MSNAMRTSKRVLAGVAAGALALALVPFVGTTSANAASVTASVNAVRSAGSGATAINLPSATMAWKGASSIVAASTVQLTTAPSASATMFLNNNNTNDDTILLNKNGLVGNAISDSTADDSIFSFRVNTAGNYAGRIFNGTDTVSFSFATAGAPTSMALAPASQTVQIGSVALLTLTLLDANGNPTQPQTVDAVNLTSTDDTLVASAASSGTAITGLDSAALATGVGKFALATNPTTGGTTTITATPVGTLPPAVTAQTATVTKAGSVSTIAVKSITLSAPTNAIQDGTAPVTTAQVPSPTTSLTVAVDDTTLASVPAGNSLRFKVTSNRGTVNGVSGATGAFVNVTTDASKKASFPVALGGTAAVEGAEITITQVTVLDANTPQAASLTVDVLTPRVQADSVVATPRGTIVAAVGAKTPVTVQVDDSFGSPAAGWLVSVARSTAPSTAISTGTTNASGAAQVEVSPLASTVAGGSESYVFTAINPITALGVDAAVGLTVNYSATGNITSLSVAPQGGAATFTAAAPTQTSLPVISVPSSGTVSGTTSSGVRTVANATTAGAITSLAEFRITTVQQNAVTVTVPEGLKVITDRPTSNDPVLWSAGSQTAVVQGNGTSSVFVFGTKTGTHDVTFTSANLSAIGKIVVGNAPSDAYKIALTPAEQSVAIGAIGTATLSVTDVFGNPVQTGTADDSGPVTIAASGQALLAGFLTSNTFTTNASGEATVTFIAGNAVGQAILTATPKAGSTLAQWSATTAFSPPAGAPAPVLSAVAEVGVGEAPLDPSILIEGSRENRRINIDGVTTGLAEGTEVYPFIRFPGQTGFTQGTAVRTVVIFDELEQLGEFSWGRNTGKKTQVQFRDAADLRSNTVTIPAR